jgi:hypothetical protein
MLKNKDWWPGAVISNSQKSDDYDRR